MCSGFSEANGSWKTICTSLLYARKFDRADGLDLLAVEQDAAAGALLLAGQQLRDRALAGAALAHQRDDAAAVQLERDALYRGDDLAAPAAAVVLAQIDPREHELAGLGRRSGPRPPVARSIALARLAGSG